MYHKRFRAEEIEENLDKSDYIIVPGSRVFKKNYLARWLTESRRNSYLAVNLSLLLNKYPWWFQNKDGSLTLVKKFRKINLKNNKPKTIPHHYKDEVLEAIVKCSMKPVEGYEEIRDQHYRTPQRIEIKSITLKTKTRLAVGLSDAASVFEISLSLHPYYGFPIIPASAIKGVTRHYCEEYKLKEGGIKQVTIEKIFGKDPERGASEGNIVFYDAWPEFQPGGDSEPILEVDIMNPHYSKYYNAESLPCDNLDPVPIKFLSVRKGVEFQFATRPSSKCNDGGLASYVLSLIKEALTETGIGAKTGSGYGYFTATID